MNANKRKSRNTSEGSNYYGPTGNRNFQQKSHHKQALNHSSASQNKQFFRINMIKDPWKSLGEILVQQGKLDPTELLIDCSPTLSPPLNLHPEGSHAHVEVDKEQSEPEYMEEETETSSQYDETLEDKKANLLSYLK